MYEKCGNSSLMNLLQTVVMSRCDISNPCSKLGTDEIKHKEWYFYLIIEF